MKLIIKETFVTIRRSYKRFISILLIVLLGVGFFAGIKATSPDMQKTINNYYKANKFEDIELISTWGITDDDISTLKNKGYNIEGFYSFDSVIISNDNEEVVKVMSYDKNKELNKIILLDGRLPMNDDECVIETSEYTKFHGINDTITVENDNLKKKTLKIVGIVKSPYFISLERGTTNLLTGKINYFIYVPATNFDISYYTNAAIYLDMDMYTSKYDNTLKSVKDDLKLVTSDLANDRFKKEREEALGKYNDALKKLNNSKVKTFNEIEKGYTKINEAYKTYQDNLKLLLESKDKVNDYFLSEESKLKDNKNNLEKSLESINENILKLESVIANNTATDDIILTYNELTEKKELINKSISDIDEGIIILNDKKVSELNKIDASQKELEKIPIKLGNEKKSLAKKEKVAKNRFKEEEKRLSNVKKEILDLKKPSWYILDRKKNVGFYQFDQDVTRIKNLGMLFPLVFFVVAILICLTSMTRMVEEERSQLGTLKSLGFTSNQILLKYILYATIATLVGAIIGLLIGFNLLPDVIFNMYSMMYNVGKIHVEFNYYYAILATLTALFCTLFATIIVARKSLKENPAELMRPKQMKSGKRILLEKIPFIWKRLNFNRKVTMRNVFRYKKRMIMTIVGVAGCTGLIIAAFGLKDCITGMVSNQYGNIFKYQVEVTLSEVKNNDEIFEKIKNFKETKEAGRFLKENVTLNNYSTNQSIQLVGMVDDITPYVSLKNRKTSTLLNDSEGMIITEKIAELLNIKKGDVIDFKGTNTYKLPVKEITENYMYHYIYLNKDLYNSDKYNTILINTDKMNEKEEKEFASKIKEIDGVSKLSYTSSMANVFDSTMKNFEYVVVVLIISANLLAFVVLYNLASVNISERKRELATIKVLGFYDKEVFDYIGRETTILTVISLIFGIFTGNILTTFIIKTCELDMIMFNPRISIQSYVYGIILTILFTIVVNITTYFALKKIEMVESLKSVE